MPAERGPAPVLTCQDRPSAPGLSFRIILPRTVLSSSPDRPVGPGLKGLANLPWGSGRISRGAGSFTLFFRRPLLGLSGAITRTAFSSPPPVGRLYRILAALAKPACPVVVLWPGCAPGPLPGGGPCAAPLLSSL